MSNSQENTAAHPKAPSKKRKVKWYYVAGNRQSGPHTESEMLELIAEGKAVQSGTLVWRTGFDSWVQAGNTSLFADANADSERLSAVPPRFADVMGRQWLLALACTPVFLLMMLARTPDGARVFSPYGCGIAAFALNAAAIIFDMRKMEKYGFTLSRWCLLGFILPPVYLAIRETKTKAGYVDLILWFLLIIFALYCAINPSILVFRKIPI